MLLNKKLKTVKMLPAKGTVINDMIDFGKDPFFIKKAEAAKKRVDIIGIPKNFCLKNNVN